MINKFLLLNLFVFQFANGWQITFTCSPHGKSGADVENLIVKNTDGKSREIGEDTVIVATAKKLSLKKKMYTDVTFKGLRSQSVKGPYYTLEADPVHKKIKSITINSTPDGEELGEDELKTADDKKFAMTCNEVEVLDCALPEIPAQVPKGTTWVGSCDGGHWINVVQMKPKQVRLKIYKSDSGELLKEGWFVFDENCQAKTIELLKGDLKNYDGDVILLRRMNPKEEPPQNCYLKPVK
jgi:hypothetical protein